MSLTSFILSFLQPPQKSITAKKIFPDANYHPLHGIAQKVDRPSMNFKTIFPSRPKFIGTHLNGSSLDRHFVGTPAYRDAWEARKSKSFWNESHIGQISHESRNRPWQEKRLMFSTTGGQTKTISSREPGKIFHNNFFSSALSRTLPKY